MKYAARQLLYPVPNVFDCCDGVIIVARAGRIEKLFSNFFCCVVRGVVDIALRAVVVGRTFCVVRGVVAPRVRWVLFGRVVIFVVVARDVFCWTGWRAVTRCAGVFICRADVFCFVPERDIEFASRSAALAIPIPTINAIRNEYVLFILFYNDLILSKYCD